MMAKVCGPTSAADVAAALDAGADLLGFLQHPASPRHCLDLGLVRLAGDRAVLVLVADAAEPVLALARRAGAALGPAVPAGFRTGPGRGSAARRGRRVLLPWPDEPDQGGNRGRPLPLGD